MKNLVVDVAVKDAHLVIIGIKIQIKKRNLEIIILYIIISRFFCVINYIKEISIRFYRYK